MLVLSVLFTFLGIASLELELDTYEMDVGAAPSWMTEEQQKAAITDRWYVEKTTATCKPFKYLGSLGNFNNFVSLAVCMHHLSFTPEEKVNACELTKSDGKCTVPEASREERWYFSKTAVSGGAANSCYSFKYTGCGGNANNFKSEDECKNACQNKESGKMDSTTGITKVPNKFDCLFTPDIKGPTPKMGIVFHTDGNRCVYAAIGTAATRGFFPDLPTCVETCVEEKNMVPACKAEEAFQVPITGNAITSWTDTTEYFYYDVKNKVCRRFRSKAPAEGSTIKIDDGTNNIFSSAELCASFCPATGLLGDIKAVDVCKQPKVGVAADDAKYQLTRHYYTAVGSGVDTATCTSFKSNGKEINLNNFASTEACTAICLTPLGTS